MDAQPNPPRSVRFNVLLFRDACLRCDPPYSTLKSLARDVSVHPATVERAAKGEPISWRLALCLAEALKNDIWNLAAPGVRSITPSQFDSMENYFMQRGPRVMKRYIQRPSDPEAEIRRASTIDQVREHIRRQEQGTAGIALRRPIQVTIDGTFFAAALLASGWWQRMTRGRSPSIRWVSDVQRWGFIGFNDWGPSWDFSWQLDNWDESKKRLHFFGQFGDGDEADSIPVYVPQAMALRSRQDLMDWGGMAATVTGILGHRSHFPEQGTVKIPSPGGWLDYCIWLDPDNPKHRLERSTSEADVYSGYLWKCFALRRIVETGVITPRDVWIRWVHVDFSRPAALQDGIECFALSEQVMRNHIERETGDNDCVLLAKSTAHLAGEPVWNADEMGRLLNLREVRQGRSNAQG